MPVYVCEESSYAGPIPDDEILAAQVIAVTEKKKPFQDDQGKDIIKVEFTFQITDPASPWDGQKLWGDTSKVFTTNTNCRLRNWAQELFALELPAGFALDTDHLIGKSCRVVVGSRTYEKDGEEKTRNFVKDCIRAKSGSSFATADEEPF